MSTNYHLCVSVRGLLNKTKTEQKRDIKSMTKEDDSRFGSVEEYRNALYEELAQGHEVLKTGPCDNFDWKKGCQGHTV